MTRQRPVEVAKEDPLAAAVKEVLAPPKEKPIIKLDLGCGKNKREGFLGVDRRKFPGVDAVADLTEKQWAFDVDFLDKYFPIDDDSDTSLSLPDSSVTEAHCSHFLE